MTFWDWLLIKWRSFQVAALSIPRSSDCWVAIHGVDGPQPVLPFTPDRHLGCFQFGAILSTAAVVVRVRDSVRTFHFSRISTREGSFWAAGWSKNLPSCLPKGCADHDEREPPRPHILAGTRMVGVGLSPFQPGPRGRFLFCNPRCHRRSNIFHMLLNHTLSSSVRVCTDLGPTF